MQVIVLKVQEAKVALVSFSDQCLRRSSVSRKEPGHQILQFDFLGRIPIYKINDLIPSVLHVTHQ